MKGALLAIMAIATINLTGLPGITNDKFYPLYGDTHRYNVLVGGAGSGKSVFCAQREVVKATVEDGHKILVVRKVGESLRDSVIPEMTDAIHQLGFSDIWKPRASPPELHSKINGSQIIFRGLDSAEKKKSIKGLTRVWIEEATELTEEDWDQLDLRIRGLCCYPPQYTLSFNPITFHHWLRRKFWDETPESERIILQTTYRDNRFIDAAYVRKIERLKKQNPYLYQVYGLGEWGIPEGAIYKPAVMDDWPETFDDEYYGLDFGFNNPMAMVWIGIKDVNWQEKSGDTYVREMLYRSGMTTPDLISWLKSKDSQTAITKPIYADSAEPARIKELKQAGFDIRPASKVKDSVKAGIDLCQCLSVHSLQSNVNYNAERATYCWEKDKEGKFSDSKGPVKMNDHLMDAERYANFTHRRNCMRGGFESYAG